MSGHISAPAIPSRTAFAYFMSAPGGATCPSLLSLRLARSCSAPLCSCTMRWTPGHSTRLGSPEFLSLRHSGSAASVAHSRSTSSVRQQHADLLQFISSLPVRRLSFRTSAGVSSSAHATGMPTSLSCHAKSPNQSMKPTAAWRGNLSVFATTRCHGLSLFSLGLRLCRILLHSISVGTEHCRRAKGIRGGLQRTQFEPGRVADALQSLIRVVEGNSAFGFAARVKNPNLARAKTGAPLCVAHCLFLRQKHRLHSGALVHAPAVSEWPYFDDCHNLSFAFCSKRP